MICAGRSFGTGKFVVPPSGGAEPGKFVVPRNYELFGSKTINADKNPGNIGSVKSATYVRRSQNDN